MSKASSNDEIKSNSNEQNILSSTNVVLPKTIIIFDGHGLTNKKEAPLKFKHYFLCDEGETLGSDVFNTMVKQLVKDRGLTDLSSLSNNSDSKIEHFLFELTNLQKLSSTNLRKALALITDGSYQLYEIGDIFTDHKGKSYNFKMQFTNFHPITKQKLVFVRIEDKQYVKLSTLEELIFPIFVNKDNPVMESCGMPIHKFESEASEAVGLWGACREIDENI